MIWFSKLRLYSEFFLNMLTLNSKDWNYVLPRKNLLFWNYVFYVLYWDFKDAIWNFCWIFNFISRHYVPKYFLFLEITTWCSKLRHDSLNYSLIPEITPLLFKFRFRRRNNDILMNVLISFVNITRFYFSRGERGNELRF